MPDQPPLPFLDPSEGDKRKNEAMDRVDQNARLAFKTEAYRATWRVALSRRFFTTDEVWGSMKHDGDQHEPRALGPMMRTAAATGIIVATSDFELSSMPGCHRRPKRVWESQLFLVRLERLNA